MDLGWGEILLVGFVALLVYGGRLPEVARSVGRSVAALKRGLRETTETVTRDLDPGLDAEIRGLTRRTLRDRGPSEPSQPSVPPIDRPAPPELATEDVSRPPEVAGSGAEPGPAEPPVDQTQTGAPRR